MRTVTLALALLWLARILQDFKSFIMICGSSRSEQQINGAHSPHHRFSCGDCRWGAALLVVGSSAVAGRRAAWHTGLAITCLVLLVRLRCEDDERGQPEEQSVHPHPQQTDPGAGFWQSCRWPAAVCCSGQHSQTHQVSLPQRV